MANKVISVANKENILHKITKAEDKLLVSKLLDKAVRSRRNREYVHSGFLDPYQRAVLEKALLNVKDIYYTFSGGYEGAERVIAVFGPEPFTDETSGPELPFRVVKAKPVSRVRVTDSKLSHRDYLGSLMGLGINREKIGDILVNEDYCDIIVLEEIADFISYNLQKAGNIRLDVTIGLIGDLEAAGNRAREIKTTVASLRLDVIAGACFGMSRTKAADIIRAEYVNVNWESEKNPDKLLRQGDIISMRGKGKAVLELVGNISKKGRTFVLLKRLV